MFLGIHLTHINLLINSICYICYFHVVSCLLAGSFKSRMLRLNHISYIFINNMERNDDTYQGTFKFLKNIVYIRIVNCFIVAQHSLVTQIIQELYFHWHIFIQINDNLANCIFLKNNRALHYTWLRKKVFRILFLSCKNLTIPTHTHAILKG